MDSLKLMHLNIRDANMQSAYANTDLNKSQKCKKNI